MGSGNADASDRHAGVGLRHQNRLTLPLLHPDSLANSDAKQSQGLGIDPRHRCA